MCYWGYYLIYYWRCIVVAKFWWVLSHIQAFVSMLNIWIIIFKNSPILNFHMHCTCIIRLALNTVKGYSMPQLSRSVIRSGFCWISALITLDAGWFTNPWKQKDKPKTNTLWYIWKPSICKTLSQSHNSNHWKGCKIILMLSVVSWYCLLVQCYPTCTILLTPPLLLATTCVCKSPNSFTRVDQ